MINKNGKICFPLSTIVSFYLPFTASTLAISFLRIALMSTAL